MDSCLDSWICSFLVVHVEEALSRLLGLLPVPVSAHLKPSDSRPVAFRRPPPGRMDEYRRVPCRNDISRISTRPQYLEVSEDIDRVSSLSNAVCLRFTFPNPYNFAVRIGYALEGRVADESRFVS